MDVPTIFHDDRRSPAVPARAALDQALASIGIVILVSMPFIVGDQPLGAEALNPVEMRGTG